MRRINTLMSVLLIFILLLTLFVIWTGVVFSMPSAGEYRMGQWDNFGIGYRVTVVVPKSFNLNEWANSHGCSSGNASWNLGPNGWMVRKYISIDFNNRIIQRGCFLDIR